MVIRKAELRDVPKLFELINQYARQNVMLPRTLGDLYEHVWEFTVAEEGGRVLGCGALKFYNQELAEIRSLCVAPGRETNGMGRSLVESLLDEAGRYGLKSVFALTLAPDFFRKCGFRETRREKVPLKIWRDCVQCEKYGRCDEKTVSLDLTQRLARRTRPDAEVAAVPAWLAPSSCPGVS